VELLARPGHIDHGVDREMGDVNAPLSRRDLRILPGPGASVETIRSLTRDRAPGR
jgi:hypothetical protein